MTRRIAKSNPSATGGVGIALIVAAVAYFGWCAFNYYSTTPHAWSWTPWKLAGLGVPQIEQGRTL